MLLLHKGESRVNSDMHEQETDLQDLRDPMGQPSLPSNLKQLLAHRTGTRKVLANRLDKGELYTRDNH
jgi:hypothetical protein